MFYLLLFLVSAVTIWTVSVIKNEGVYQKEVQESLNIVFSNSKTLLKSIKTLISLLVKDMFSTGSQDKCFPSTKPLENVGYINLKEEVEEELKETEYELEETDSALKDFSSEVINLIEEEEQKIA